MINKDTIKDKANIIKLLFQCGKIDLATASSHQDVLSYINYFNELSTRTAIKYNQKPFKLSIKRFLYSRY